MADIRDEHGRPIQLTDDHGRSVQLTDEHGVPMHLTGVATTAGETPHGRTTIGSELHDTPAATTTMMGSETHSGTHFAPTPVDYAKRGTEAVAGAGAATVGVAAGVGKAVTGAVTGAPVSHAQAHDAGGDTKQVEQSTSLSSEDDGEGRKKKGLMQKIKEKLPGHNDKHAAAHSINTKPTTTAGAPATASVTVMEEHEKKGFMDKIKDKLPGHHSS